MDDDFGFGDKKGKDKVSTCVFVAILTAVWCRI